MDAECFYTQVDEGLLAEILAHAEVTELQTFSCVCQQWKQLCREHQVVEAAFKNKWHFSYVDPSIPISRMCSAQLTDFVTPHNVRRGDSLQTLAIRYKTTEVRLRALNNLMSERALLAHLVIFVPITEEPELVDKRLKMIAAGAHRRPLLVVYDKEHEDALSKFAPVNEDNLNEFKAQLLSQALDVPTGMARFYINATGGDLRAAKELFFEDADWEYSAEGQHLLANYERTKRAVWRKHLFRWMRRIFCWSCCLGDDRE